MLWLTVALGGALGALARFAIAQAWPVKAGSFPFATFTANVLGSFVAGVLFVIIVEKAILSEQWRPLLMVGFLGALTTFSTFSLESVVLLREDSMPLALGYMASTLVCCIAACFVGVSLTTRIIQV